MYYKQGTALHTRPLAPAAAAAPAAGSTDGGSVVAVEQLTRYTGPSVRGAIINPASKFATFAAAGDGVAKVAGKWYYEYVPDHGGVAQVGWQRAGERTFSPDDGVGDNQHGWAFDGKRQKKWHRGGSSYGGNSAPWAAGDVVGCLLNLDENEVIFTVNGSAMGVAFTAADGLRDTPVGIVPVRACPVGRRPWLPPRPTRCARWCAGVRV